ncbi:MAG: ABC transporter ATP-binding protein [Chloroflexi bacterium]|nr:ABC transporter ATP-binding protein [Chloroflexota bacterium]
MTTSRRPSGGPARGLTGGADTIQSVARFDRVSFAYTPAEPVFTDFSWEMQTGDSWAVIGASGCGKSTLLYLLAGLLRPRSGEILVTGSPVIGPRQDMGLILQEYGLLPWATVEANVKLGLQIRGSGGRAADEIARAWMDRLGLAHLADRYPSQLSGGQRQRVAIARTLALEPSLLLMDEPFSSLDALTREALQRVALDLGVAGGVNTVFVTHDIQEAVYLGRRILVLGTGEAHQGDHRIVDNPGAGDPDYRELPEFSVVERAVRHLVRSLGRAIG